MTPLHPSPTGTELLDDPAADPAAVALSLRHIGRSNRWFGGLGAARYGLAQVLRGVRGRVTLLDVGTGGGDLPAELARWAAARGIGLRPFGVERHPVAARVARASGLAMVRACGGTLPVRTGGVDVVLVSQVAHHLAPDACVALLAECRRAARLGVVVADLRRSRAARIGFWIGSRLLGFDRVTCADGLTSLRRGYTAPELEALLARAALPVRVRRRPGARLVAAWRATP